MNAEQSRQKILAIASEFSGEFTLDDLRPRMQGRNDNTLIDDVNKLIYSGKLLREIRGRYRLNRATPNPCHSLWIPSVSFNERRATKIECCLLEA